MPSMSSSAANAVSGIPVPGFDRLTFLLPPAGSNLRQRLISALILTPVVLLAVYLGGWVYALAVAAAVGLGLGEWLRLVDPAAPRPVIAAMYAGLLLVLVPAACGWPGNSFLILLVLTPAAWWLTLNVNRDPVRARNIALGLPYMAGAGLALVYLRALPDIGLPFVIYLLAVVWGTDIGAYLAGRIIGGPKLAPKISPQKTWAGFAGGLFLAAVLGYIVVLLLGAQPAGASVIFAVLLSAVAQMGDLFKSFFKRRAGVKDSGSLIPGHGGILDRIDGLAFAAIFFALFEALAG